MPPELAGWAQSLSLSQLPGPLALQVRQFLLRAPDLDPRVREALGASLAAEVAARTAATAPPGTAAEPYLAAVLAERRRREADRLQAQRVTAEPAARPATDPAPAGADPPAADRWKVPDGGVPSPDVPDDGFALPR
jgi:hypothetical protein